MPNGSYDTAQICLNGHPITARANAYPQFTKNFCDRCGEATICQCQQCHTPIRGDYVTSVSRITLAGYTVPSFCHNCGGAYPWTEAILKAAQELSDELDGLTDQEKETLKSSLDDIVRDTPQATVAATRFKRLVAKAGQEATEAFKQILVDVVSETIRRSIWG